MQKKTIRIIIGVYLCSVHSVKSMRHSGSLSREFNVLQSIGQRGILGSFMYEVYKNGLLNSGVVIFGECKPAHYENMNEREWLLGDESVDELCEYKNLGAVKTIRLLFLLQYSR